jgi:hypothetical protein
MATFIRIGTDLVSTGIMAIEYFSRGRSTGRAFATAKLQSKFKTGGRERPPVYFFGDVEPTGAAVDETEVDGSVNSFFRRS